METAATVTAAQPNGTALADRLRMICGEKRFNTDRRNQAALMMMDIAKRAKDGDPTLADEAMAAAREVLAG